jgi:hypothetical protein
MAFSLCKGKIMNRRTFLQSVGAAVAVVAIPATAKSEPIRYWENIPVSQWNDFADQMPPQGQRVAVLTYFCHGTGVNIFTGTVTRHKFVCDKGENVLISMELSYSPDGHFRRNTLVLGKPKDVYCDICLYGSLAREENILNAQKNIRKASWIDLEDVYAVGGPCLAPRNNYKKAPYVGRDRSYWFPISEFIPERLPAFPKPKKLNFVHEDMTWMVVK